MGRLTAAAQRRYQIRLALLRAALVSITRLDASFDRWAVGEAHELANDALRAEQRVAAARKKGGSRP